MNLVMMLLLENSFDEISEPIRTDYFSGSSPISKMVFSSEKKAEKEVFYL